MKTFSCEGINTIGKMISWWDENFGDSTGADFYMKKKDAEEYERILGKDLYKNLKRINEGRLFFRGNEIITL